MESICGIVGGMVINLLCYADDTVLIAPSGKSLQGLIDIVHKSALATMYVL